MDSAGRGVGGYPKQSLPLTGMERLVTCGGTATDFGELGSKRVSVGVARRAGDGRSLTATPANGIWRPAPPTSVIPHGG